MHPPRYSSHEKYQSANDYASTLINLRVIPITLYILSELESFIVEASGHTPYRIIKLMQMIDRDP